MAEEPEATIPGTDAEHPLAVALGEDAFKVWARRAVTFWAVIGFGVIVFAGWELFKWLAPALSPFVMGGLLAYLMRPLVRLLSKTGLGRGWATLVTVLVGVGVITLFVAFVLPVLFGNLVSFSQAVPTYLDQLRRGIVAISASLPRDMASALDSMVAKIGESVSGAANQIASFLFNAGGYAAGFVFNMFLGFILAIWFLLDGSKLGAFWLSVLPESWRDDAVLMARSFDVSLGGYIEGTLVNVVVITLGCGIGFSFAGLPYAWAVALVIGLASVIPFIGPVIGGVVAVLIGLTVSPITAVAAAVITLVVSQAVFSFLSPIVMGRSVSLHPVTIILALSLGGVLYGFFGVLVAIPVAAVVKSVYLYYSDKHSATVSS